MRFTRQTRQFLAAVGLGLAVVIGGDLYIGNR